MCHNPDMIHATNRRNFIRTAATAAALTAAPKVLGANDRIRLGVIGSGDRGRYDMSRFLTFSDVEVVALCDAWDQSLASAQEVIAKASRPTASEFADYRALLDRKDIDAVLIATPDHWHKDITIAACQAGKDVYVEKPLTRTPEEGPAIVAAARNNKRVVQVGMQQRSGDHYRLAKETYFDTKKIGKVTMARTWWHGNTYHLRKCPFTDKPAGLDWNRFVGPLAPRPWDAQQFWNWRAYLDFGGGQIRDRGAHIMSIAQWIMNADNTGPVTIDGTGEGPHDGMYDTAAKMNVVYEFKNPDWTLVWAQPGEPSTTIKAQYGAVYHGDKGELTVTYGDGQNTDTEPQAKDYVVPCGGVECSAARGMARISRTASRAAKSPL